MQERRGEILREFLEGRHSVLVATNVLGRGIDLICVSQVRAGEGGRESYSNRWSSLFAGVHF